MKEKYLFTIIIIILISVNVTSSFAEDTINMSTLNFDGNIFYVGGSGPGNYTKIQDAIDDASDGDTVFVYDDSSPYYEELIIRDSIKLLGENKVTTIIEAYAVIIIHAITDNFTLSGFTIQGGEDGIVGNLDDCTITNNIFNCFCVGINLDGSDNNIISNNTFSISEEYRSFVIGLFGSDSNIITNNIIKEGTKGFWLYGCMKNRITGNIISDNAWQGINMTDCFLNFISKNNFINNLRQVTFEDCSYNIWLRNYWDDCTKLFLYPITGTRYNILTETSIPWTTFDLMPSSQPYDINPS